MRRRPEKADRMFVGKNNNSNNCYTNSDKSNVEKEEDGVKAVSGQRSATAAEAETSDERMGKEIEESNLRNNYVNVRDDGEPQHPIDKNNSNRTGKWTIFFVSVLFAIRT